MPRKKVIEEPKKPARRPARDEQDERDENEAEGTAESDVGEELALTREEIEDEDRLKEFQEQFGGRQYYVRVERYNDSTNENEIVDRMPLDSFDPFNLGKKFNGGKFTCSLLTEKSRYVAGSRMKFVFAKPDVPDAPRGLSSDPMFQLMMSQMQSDKNMLAELLKSHLNRETPQPTNDIDKLLNGVKALHDLSPKEKAVSPLGQLKELLELQSLFKKTNGSDDGDDKGGGGLMSEVKEALSLLIQARGANPPARAPMMRPPSPGSGLPVVAQPLPGAAVVKMAPEIPLTGNQPMTHPAESILISYLPKFVDAAKANADPDKWAAFLVTILDTELAPALASHYSNVFMKVSLDDVWDRLIDAARNPESVEQIFTFAPALGDYRPWVVSVIQAAVTQVAEQEPAEPENVPVNGNGE